jgi:SAM-dependent methyltransferase
MKTFFVVLICVGIVFVLTLFFLSVNPRRNRKIDSIIEDLKKLKQNSSDDLQYAIDKNIEFFKYSRTIAGYFIWGMFKRNKIDPVKLLEVADLPLPRWEKELYSDLSHVEQKEFPGLSKPLRKLLISHTVSRKKTIILDLGCGSMEVERQVFSHSSKSNAGTVPVFIGVDSAPQAFEAITSNLKNLDVEIKEIKSLDKIDKLHINKPTILFYCGDALEVADLHGHKFDLIISSRFRHHLTESEKNKIDSISRRLTNYVIEYDDYHTKVSWIPVVLTAWSRPILLSAANFSQIRQPSKKDLISQKRQKNIKIQIFSPPGSYAKTFLKETK